jgi:hypothetical protein
MRQVAAAAGVALATEPRSSFAKGGEVPIMAHAGEFVVRRSAGSSGRCCSGSTTSGRRHDRPVVIRPPRTGAGTVTVRWSGTTLDEPGAAECDIGRWDRRGAIDAGIAAGARRWM